MSRYGDLAFILVAFCRIKVVASERGYVIYAVTRVTAYMTYERSFVLGFPILLVGIWLDQPFLKFSYR